MQLDFHYYATYAAAYIAGYSHEESLDICYSDQFVDMCTRMLLSKLNAPFSCATTQSQLELADSMTDTFGLQNMTRIWASFHFLPYDLYAETERKVSKKYLRKYRLICNANGALIKDTVELAKGKPLQAVGIAMHVLADTWAHKYFAGTPSLVINNTNHHFYEIIKENGELTERQVNFAPNPLNPDNPETGNYVNTLFQISEKSIMNLGHGRAGHLPDYSFMRYKYLPAWDDYEEIVKDNPSDYFNAFTQMIYAMKFLRSGDAEFETNKYDTEAVAEWETEIKEILEKRQLDSSEDWKAFAEKLSGQTIEDFDVEKYQAEYENAEEDDKPDTFLGKFFLAAMHQKSMVTNRIYKSGSMLAGFSVDYKEKGFRGISDFKHLILSRLKGDKNDN